jgi:hypothetical protein
MKIGLIQTGGIGDIIIALPIAKYFVDRGHEILWPIDEGFLPSFVAAAPYVEFIPVKRGEPRSLLDVPLECLKARGCERIIPLYSYLRNRNEAVNQGLAKSLKFDEYKYAISGVPFREKWNLQIVRDRVREERLFQEVVRSPDFIVGHLRGSDGFFELDLSRFAEGREVVEITPRGNNIFDWLGALQVDTGTRDASDAHHAQAGAIEALRSGDEPAWHTARLRAEGGNYDVDPFCCRIRELVVENATLQVIAESLLAESFEKRLRITARSNAEAQLLMSAPGVGAIVSLTVASAIDDPARFKSSKQVGAHFGMTPKKYQSGETDITGRISKIGDKGVRTALYQATTHRAHETGQRAGL